MELTLDNDQGVHPSMRSWQCCHGAKEGDRDRADCQVRPPEAAQCATPWTREIHIAIYRLKSARPLPTMAREDNATSAW
jgi:hypothetical protein